MKKFRLNLRIEEFDNLENLSYAQIPILKKPTCESQVAIMFAALLSNEKTKDHIKHITKIGNYSHQSTTDMICIDKINKKVLVEFEYKLSNLFKHEHPYDTFDYIVCWVVDMIVNDTKKLHDGNSLLLMQEHGEWLLKYGTQKVIPIIELKAIIAEFKKDTFSDAVIGN